MSYVQLYYHGPEKPGNNPLENASQQFIDVFFGLALQHEPCPLTFLFSGRWRDDNIGPSVTCFLILPGGFRKSLF